MNHYEITWAEQCGLYWMSTPKGFPFMMEVDAPNKESAMESAILELLTVLHSMGYNAKANRNSCGITDFTVTVNDQTGHTLVTLNNFVIA